MYCKLLSLTDKIKKGNHPYMVYFIAHPTVAEDKVQHIVVDRRDYYWPIVEDEIIFIGN